MQTKESLIRNIVIAMRLSGVHQITEGGLYWALFRQDVDADTATGIVKEAVDRKILTRNGHVLILNNGEESTPWTRAICNS